MVKTNMPLSLDMFPMLFPEPYYYNNYFFYPIKNEKVINWSMLNQVVNSYRMMGTIIEIIPITKEEEKLVLSSKLGVNHELGTINNSHISDNNVSNHYNKRKSIFNFFSKR